MGRLKTRTLGELNKRNQESVDNLTTRLKHDLAELAVRHDFMTTLVKKFPDLEFVFDPWTNGIRIHKSSFLSIEHFLLDECECQVLPHQAKPTINPETIIGAEELAFQERYGDVEPVRFTYYYIWEEITNHPECYHSVAVSYVGPLPPDSKCKVNTQTITNSRKFISCDVSR